MSKVYEIDPDADALLIVRPTAEAFAPWPQEAPSGSSIPPPPEVRIKVSSKHLSLASAYFHDHFAFKSKSAAFSGSTVSTVASNASLWGGKATANGLNASEITASNEIQPDGRVHIILDGVDGNATTTVLNIVHGRAGGERVPKTIDLETLARIAVVVDRFQLQDTVEVYADRWVGELQRRGLPTKPGRDLVLWIYVAYVFRKADLFRESTRLAATLSPGPLPALNGLPLRAKIVTEIDQQRQEAIGKSLDLLQTAVDRLVRGSEASHDGNEDDTDSFLLGNLIRTLHSNGLIWPRPAQPYAGISVVAISRAAHEVQTKVWKLANRLNDSNSSSASTKQLLLTPQIDSLRAGIAGLDLKSGLGYLLY